MLLKVTREEVLATFDGDLISALEERMAHADCAQDQEVASWAIDEINQLRSALKPFSEEASFWFTRNYNSDDQPVENFEDYEAVMTCGDLFRARQALTPTPTPTEGEPTE